MTPVAMAWGEAGGGWTCIVVACDRIVVMCPFDLLTTKLALSFCRLHALLVPMQRNLWFAVGHSPPQNRFDRLQHN